MLFQILEDWRDTKAKKTLDDTHFHIKKEFIKSTFRSTNKAKQVLVKNIGNCSKRRLENALRYTIKNSDLSKAIDQDGKEVSVDEILGDWKKDFSNKENSKEGWHLVFSINEEVNARNMKTLEKAVKDTMEKNFFEYKYVLVKHTHQNNPHIHVIVNKNNIFTKKKLHFKDNGVFKEFFNTIKDDFAMALNYYDPKLKYVNLSKHDRDLELQRMQENAFADLDIKLSLDKRAKKLEVQSVINSNKIEQNNKSIREINVEQRIFAKKGENAIDEILKNQEKLKELEKANQTLRKNNQSITRFLRDFNQLKQNNISSPFFKQKAVEFLKKNPKMLTLRQIVALPRIEKMIAKEMQEIQKFEIQKSKQNLEHTRLLWGFQKSKTILDGIRDCEINCEMFPDQKYIFRKNISILEEQLQNRGRILDEKILGYKRTEDFLMVLEKENSKIENYFRINKKEKKVPILPSGFVFKTQSTDGLFEEIEKEKNKQSINSQVINELECGLAKKVEENNEKILILQKSLLKRDWLVREREGIETYFNQKNHNNLYSKGSDRDLSFESSLIR